MHEWDGVEVKMCRFLRYEFTLRVAGCDAVEDLVSKLVWVYRWKIIKSGHAAGHGKLGRKKLPPGVLRLLRVSLKVLVSGGRMGWGVQEENSGRTE